jgi:Ca2+-binding EF-hand superfamily protein
VERVVGTLFALTLIGTHGKASAEPHPARTRMVHESRAKGVPPPPADEVSAAQAEVDSESSRVLPGLDETLPQLERVAGALLELADADRDARLSRGELEELLQRHVLVKVRSRFARLDRNGDGRVTRFEVPTMDKARFARFDRNVDGAFTRAELAVVMRAQVGRRCATLLARYDIDGDGVLTLADVREGTRQRLAQLQPVDPAQADPVK